MIKCVENGGKFICHGYGRAMDAEVIHVYVHLPPNSVIPYKIVPNGKNGNESERVVIIDNIKIVEVDGKKLTVFV